MERSVQGTPAPRPEPCNIIADILSIVITQRLREERLAQGLTLEELARRTGIAASNLSRLERAGSDPRASTLERVLRGLGLRLTTERAVVLTLSDIESRMAEGAGRLERAGTGNRDAAARLKWKERRGADTGVERRLLAGR